MINADYPQRGGVDPAVARALDRFNVPPPTDAFLARVTAIADVPPPVRLAMPFAPRWKGRLQTRGRGPWVRRTAIGLIAVGLASATAAAAGMFEAVRFELPMIAQLLTPTSPRQSVAKVAQTKPKPAPKPDKVKLAAADPVVEPSPAAPVLLTPAERAERFRALPMPLRAVVTERMVTRTQRRLASRGVFVPRAMVRDRVTARTGQTDLPSGTPAEQRAQVRAAIIAAPPGSLPPRLERWRTRLLMQQSGAGIGSGAFSEGVTASTPSVADANAPVVEDSPARQAWRALRADQMLRWRARKAERAARAASGNGSPDPAGQGPDQPATPQTPPVDTQKSVPE